MTGVHARFAFVLNVFGLFVTRQKLAELKQQFFELLRFLLELPVTILRDFIEGFAVLAILTVSPPPCVILVRSCLQNIKRMRLTLWALGEILVVLL
jgi:hypothetical protein